MDRKKIDKTLSSVRLAAKVVAKMKARFHGRVVDLGKVFNSRALAEGFQESAMADKELAGLPPALAAYGHAQSQVAIMLEQLTSLKEMAPLVNIVSKAEDLYMPGGPPMSPLTDSYFNFWAFYDACVGEANETIGTTVLEIGAAFGMDRDLLRLIRCAQESRMSLCIHKGTKGGLAVLEEPVTGEVRHSLVPAGYLGKKDELWYARVLPPPIQGDSEHIVVTTPYILRQPGIDDWMAYFRRTCPAVEDYKRHMKYGPTRTYWHDFVLEAYVNYRTEAIYLAGLPDIPESRPHSQVNGWGHRKS